MSHPLPPHPYGIHLMATDQNTAHSVPHRVLDNEPAEAGRIHCSNDSMDCQPSELGDFLGAWYNWASVGMKYKAPKVERIKAEISFHEKMFFAALVVVVAIVEWVAEHY